MPAKKKAEAAKKNFLHERSPGVAVVFVIAAMLIIGLTAMTGILLSGLTVTVPSSNIEIKAPQDAGYSSYLRMINKQYSFTEYGRGFAQGDAFDKSKHNYSVTVTPTLVLNCKYKRTGTYALMDAKAEALDLKDAICKANGNCTLTAAEYKELTDRKASLQYSTKLEQISDQGCNGEVYVVYSPECTYCAAQYPILSSLAGNVRFGCIASGDNDAMLCDTMRSLKGKEGFTAVDTAAATGGSACDASFVLKLMAEWSLAKQ